MALLESPEAALPLVQKPQHKLGKEIRGRGRSSVFQFLLLSVPAAELSPFPRPVGHCRAPWAAGLELGVTRELRGEMLQRRQRRFSTDSLSWPAAKHPPAAAHCFCGGMGREVEKQK